MQSIVVEELAQNGFRSITPGRGGVYFKGHMGRANRVLGCPSRILWMRGKFNAFDFQELKQGIAKIDLSPVTGFTVHASSSKSTLYHSDAIQTCVESVIPKGPIGLYVRVHRNQVMVSIDTSGALLYRRGWRLENGPAPVRETIAHALLRFADWGREEPLYDPMCGSGTFLIEAAGLSAGLAPSRLRDFACDGWTTPGRQLAAGTGNDSITGSDRDDKVIASARRNAQRAGVSIKVTSHKAEAALAPAPSGLLICNPPYGLRLKQSSAYAVLGQLMANQFKNWRGAIICPDEESRRALRRSPSKVLHFSMGGLGLDFCVFEPAGD